MKRLFVAIELPHLIALSLAELDPGIRGARWLAPEQMHLTLGFLGNVPEDTEDALKKNLEAIAWKPFFLSIVGLGKFPSKGPPNVLWIGVGSGHPHLFQLHKRVQEAALQSGIELELRSYHPHVTLARCRDVPEQSPKSFLREHGGFDAGMVHVETFCLNSSRRTSTGSIYRRELACPSTVS